MSTPDLRAVVFDLDGLMFNTEDLYQEVGTEILKRRGFDFSHELKSAMMGRPGPVAYQIMIEWHQLTDDTPETLAAEADTIFPAILDEKLAPMPGLLELLDRLEAAGLPKAIATSSGLAFVQRVLAPLELAPRFEFILTRENVTEGKPHPEIYLLAAQKLGFSPEQVLVLEDSHNGCLAAHAAGTFLAAVPGVHSRGHDFSMAGLCLESLEDARLYDALGLPKPE